MSTVRQERLADEIIKNAQREKPLTKEQMSVAVGYSPKTAEDQMTRIFNGEGVKDALIAKGFTVEAADDVVKELLHNGRKEETRLKAAGMMYERLGANAPKKTMNLDVKVDASPEDLKLIAEFEEKRRKQIEQ